MLRYFKYYPVSLFVVSAIWYLSFFTPPQSSLNYIPYMDKIVHVCMYGGLSTTLWIEYLIHHRFLAPKRVVAGAIVCPALMSGCIEMLQATCTDTRSGDWLDFAANCTGIILASLAGYCLWRPLIRKHLQK